MNNQETLDRFASRVAERFENDCGSFRSLKVDVEKNGAFVSFHAQWRTRKGTIKHCRSQQVFTGYDNKED